MNLRATHPGGSSQGILKARVVLVCYWILNAGIEAIRHTLWPRRRPYSARNVCVYRIGNVGDTICAFPAISAIRQEFPTARLVLLTSPGHRGLPGAREVLSGVNWIDEIIEYFPEDIRTLSELLAFLRMIRAHHFDIFIELPNDLERLRLILRNMLFARLAGAKWAGGWMIRTLRVATRAQSEWIAFPNEVERLLQDLNRYGIQNKTAEYDLPTPPAARNNAERLLNRVQTGPSPNFVALAHGAKRPANRWPIDRFAEVGKELAQRGYHVLMLGSAADYADAETVRERVGTSCTNMAGLLDITSSMAVLRSCVLLVCNDSGLQHAASAVGTPCVSVFSARDMYGKWRPHHDRSIMIRKTVPCHTCFVDQCPNNNICLTAISTEEVVTAALRLLEDPSEHQATRDAKACGSLPSIATP